MKFDSKLINEYKNLKTSLENNTDVVAMVLSKQELYNQLSNLNEYSSSYATLKIEYERISLKLSQHVEYMRFKSIERELNLFVMYCNKELDKLFSLNKKGCSK